MANSRWCRPRGAARNGDKIEPAAAISIDELVRRACNVLLQPLTPVMLCCLSISRLLHPRARSVTRLGQPYDLGPGFGVALVVEPERNLFCWNRKCVSIGVRPRQADDKAADPQNTTVHIASTPPQRFMLSWGTLGRRTTSNPDSSSHKGARSGDRMARKKGRGPRRDWLVGREAVGSGQRSDKTRQDSKFKQSC